jgi:hypothetical protein
MSFWMTRYRKLSGSKLSRGTPIRFMRWVLERLNSPAPNGLGPSTLSLEESN